MKDVFKMEQAWIREREKDEREEDPYIYINEKKREIEMHERD